MSSRSVSTRTTKRPGTSAARSGTWCALEWDEHVNVASEPPAVIVQLGGPRPNRLRRAEFTAEDAAWLAIDLQRAVRYLEGDPVLAHRPLSEAYQLGVRVGLRDASPAS